MNFKEETLRKITAGELRADSLSPEEEAMFTEPNELKEIQKILQTTADWAVNDSVSADNSWEAIQSKIKEPISINWRRRWLSVAASIALIAAAAYLFIPSKSLTEVSTNQQEIKTISLPDGSTVTLNAVSSIKYQENLTEDRVVWLEGKARFDVKSGSQFIVKSGEYETIVLGTSFDVYYEDNLFEVSCYSGSVKVKSIAGEIVLSKGEKSEMGDNSILEKAPFDAKESASWVDGEFYFDGTPLVRVIDEMQKQFGIEVQGIENDTRLYKGYFYKDDLVGSLELVFRPMGYDYKLEGNIVTLK